ncbi:MAG: hypothetical protein ABFS56_21775 [Pseudomonadota bacterium]
MLKKREFGFYATLLVWALMSPLAFCKTDCATAIGIPQTECEALVALYNSTDGANWVDNTKWNVTNKPCNWYGLSCSGGRVSELDLYSNQLSGSIPSQLGNLTQLTMLDLSDNELSGSIPTELGSLTNLMALELSDNQLTGSIPSQLGNLTSLNWLCLPTNSKAQSQ